MSKKEVEGVGDAESPPVVEGSDIPSPKATTAKDWRSWSVPQLECWVSVNRPDHKLPKQNRQKDPATGKFVTTWKEQLLQEVWELKSIEIEAPGIGEVRKSARNPPGQLQQEERKTECNEPKKTKVVKAEELMAYPQRT
eukprot:g3456.t1